MSGLRDRSSYRAGCNRFEEAVALFGDLLNKSLTLDEKWQLVEMVEAIAAVEGPSEGQTESIKVLKRRIGISPAG